MNEKVGVEGETRQMMDGKESENSPRSSERSHRYEATSLCEVVATRRPFEAAPQGTKSQGYPTRGGVREEGNIASDSVDIKEIGRFPIWKSRVLDYFKLLLSSGSYVFTAPSGYFDGNARGPRSVASCLPFRCRRGATIKPLRPPTHRRLLVGRIGRPLPTFGAVRASPGSDCHQDPSNSNRLTYIRSPVPMSHVMLSQINTTMVSDLRPGGNNNDAYVQVWISNSCSRDHDSSRILPTISIMVTGAATH
ncbi:hypothetical protein BJY52DRAFT_1230000 [Lactarius psammicola]|nr:hypothetical protein BJY52DRAFT_1230000 [Lactarius psammicola]